MNQHTDVKHLTLAYQELINHTGDDVSRPGLQESARRAAEAFQNFTEGYRETLLDVLREAVFPAKSNDLVVIRDIEFYSLCEHHLLPFFGRCHIAYIPTDKVLGLSKFSVLVKHFSRRLQIQENLTHDIAEAIVELTAADGVAVILEAQQLCMSMRGYAEQDAKLTTTVSLGNMKEDSKLGDVFKQMIGI